MRRFPIVLGIVLTLLLIFTGSALAQDLPGLPDGNTLTFLPALKNNEQNVPAGIPVPEPGWAV